MIWKEENESYQIEFNEDSSIIELHDIYHSSMSGYTLSDVDLVIVDNDTVIFMEYKNYDVGRNEPENDLHINDKLHNKIAKKYYDSYISIKSIPHLADKKICYYFVLENRKVDAGLRVPMFDKIKRKLPFQLHTFLQYDTIPFINQFKILTIAQWNNEFPQFKLEKI